MYQLSACEIAKKVQAKEISAKSVVQYFLSRIEAFDSEIGAFLEVYSGRALHQAELLDQKIKEGKKVGRLAGVPIGVKDNIHVKGQITTCGSKFLSNYKAPFDATVCRLIEEEDGIIIGKCNLDEFAMGSSNEYSAYYPTRNPWDLSRVPGGSSGGSSAAVAARLCPITLGTDTGGSIRQPAAFTGTYGFKPTYGRVSRYGLVAFGSSFDQIGPLANFVEDIALIMEVMGKHCTYDSTSIASSPEPYLDHIQETIQGKIVGYPKEFLNHLPHEIQESFDKGMQVLENLGTKIVPIEVPYLKYSIPVYYILSTAEASTNLARFDGIRYGKRIPANDLSDIYEYSRQEGFGFEVKQRILLGTYVLSSGYQDAFYKKAQRIRTVILRDCEKAFQSCDVIILPTCPNHAFHLGEIRNPVSMYQQDLYTIFANLAGLPAISLPLPNPTQTIFPYSFQIVGPQMEDNRVLRFAHQMAKKVGHFFIPENYQREV